MKLRSKASKGNNLFLSQDGKGYQNYKAHIQADMWCGDSECQTPEYNR